MKYFFIILVLIFCTALFADETALLNEYNMLIEDLKNTDTVGYKSKSAESTGFDFSQGAIIAASGNFDFSVSGKGFFKVYDEKSKTEFFTRNGSFFINGDGELMNSDGYKALPEFTVNPKKLDKLYFDNNKFIFKDGKNILEYRFTLYLPANNNGIKRIKNYFQFDGSNETSDFKLTGKSLEMSNVNITPSLIRMIYILNALDKIGSKKIKEIRLKISFTERLMEAVNNWQISINQEYVILEIKKMFTKEELDESKRLSLMKKILNDYLPFLEQDYE